MSAARARARARAIPPGGTVGILGGGQLGRMLAAAAGRLGYRTHVYAPQADSVAADFATRFTCAPFDDEQALREFAAGCDVVTYEFENVPVAPLRALGQVALRSNARALETAQDRLEEKNFVAALGGTSGPFRAVATRAELEQAIAEIGAPGILKTRREGYDGKGQWRFASADEAIWPGGATSLIYERLVRFEAEFSVILARGLEGEIRFYDSAENDHSSGILSRSVLPAGSAVLAQVKSARELSARVAEALDYCGVLTLEFFACENGPLFNEMAPRVHNSGHWTIEGALTSQFENHIRAICGLPLGDTALIAPGVEMENLIGDQLNRWPDILADPAAHLHIYGKSEIRDRRKMGHVTRLARGSPA